MESKKLNRFLREEKGSMSDLIMIPLAVLLVIISALVGWTILHNFQAAGVVENKYMNDGKAAIEIFDLAMIFIIIGIIAGAVILASQIETHPVFAIASMLFLCIVVIVTAIMSDVGYYIMTATEFVTAAAQFTTLRTIINNQPLLVAVGGVLIMMAMYAKRPRATATF